MKVYNKTEMDSQYRKQAKKKKKENKPVVTSEKCKGGTGKIEVWN